MKKYSKLDKMIRKLMELRLCDVIIFGDRYCVGLYYDREVHAAPVVVFKTTSYKKLYLKVAVCLQILRTEVFFNLKPNKLSLRPSPGWREQRQARPRTVTPNRQIFKLEVCL